MAGWPTRRASASAKRDAQEWIRSMRCAASHSADGRPLRASVAKEPGLSSWTGPQVPKRGGPDSMTRGFAPLLARQRVTPPSSRGRTKRSVSVPLRIARRSAVFDIRECLAIENGSAWRPRENRTIPLTECDSCPVRPLEYPTRRPIVIVLQVDRCLHSGLRCLRQLEAQFVSVIADVPVGFRACPNPRDQAGIDGQLLRTAANLLERIQIRSGNPRSCCGMCESALPTLDESGKPMGHENYLQVARVLCSAVLDVVDDPLQRRVPVHFEDVPQRLVPGKSHVSHNEDVLAGSNFGSHHELEGEPLPATPADFQLAGSLGGTEQAENAEVADLSLVVIVEWNDAGLG